MNNGIRTILILFWLCFLTTSCNNTDKDKKENTTAKKYNIVFILADDLAWNQVGFTNGTKFYETPNIDKIAAAGMIFTRAYAAAPICSPSRASLMTGKYPARLHITDYIPGNPYPYERLSTPQMVTALPLSEVTIAEMLKSNGYVTGHFGKWHLNVDKNYQPNRPGDPGSQGFDDVLNTEKPKDTDDPNNDAHKSKLITERTLAFLDKNKGSTFFAYVSFNCVHRPLMERKELIDKYAAKPGSKDSVNNPVMGAMIETMDKGIGQILAKLDELHLTDNTLVVFYSDNGGLRQSQSQRPLYGGKATIYEGGTRVPLAIKCPGLIKPGTNNATPVSTMDFFPTFASLVGNKSLPADIDGYDLMPLLKGTGTINREALYWHYPHYHHLGFKPGGSIVMGNYKLIEWFEPYLTAQKGSINLFDLSKDVGEQHDLSAAMPEKAKELQDKLHQWQKQMNVQYMQVNPGFDEAKRDWEDKEGKGIE